MKKKKTERKLQEKTYPILRELITSRFMRSEVINMETKKKNKLTCVFRKRLFLIDHEEFDSDWNITIFELYTPSRPTG